MVSIKSVLCVGPQDMSAVIHTLLALPSLLIFSDHHLEAQHRGTSSNLELRRGGDSSLSTLCTLVTTASPRDQGKKLTGRMAAMRTDDRLCGLTDTPLHLTARHSWHGIRGSHNETLSLSDPLRCLWLSQHIHGPCWDSCRASGPKASFLTRPLLLVVQTSRGVYYLQRGLKGELHGGPDRWSCCRVPGELDEGRAPSAMHCPKKGRHVQNLLTPHLDKRYAWENLVCILTRKSAFPLKMATQP